MTDWLARCPTRPDRGLGKGRHARPTASAPRISSLATKRDSEHRAPARGVGSMKMGVGGRAGDLGDLSRLAAAPRLLRPGCLGDRAVRAQRLHKLDAGPVRRPHMKPPPRRRIPKIDPPPSAPRAEQRRLRIVASTSLDVETGAHRLADLAKHVKLIHRAASSAHASCASPNSLTFSTAMAACAANAVRTSIPRAENGSTSSRRTRDTPTTPRSATSGRPVTS